jgi:ribosomal protein S4
MARYTGPRVRVLRAIGVNLPGLSAKTMEKRPAPPGQHGARRLEVDSSALTARVTSIPGADAVPFPIELQLVVEFYS